MGIPLGPDLPTVTFAPSDELPARSSDLMAWIRDEHMFADRPRHGFVAGLTIALATANKLHPFREGNGRVQRILAEHIAQHAGYRLDWSEIPAYAQDAAQFAAYHDQPEYLAGILDSALTEIPRTTSPWRLPGTGTDVLAAARTSTHSPATAPASAPLHATQLGYGD
jgi:cell filamentation protein